MKLEEKTISSTLIHKGRITEYYDDEVLLPDGKVANREYVTHMGGAAILALDEQENVYLVRQFRYPYKEEIFEIPAGKREKGEEPLACAVRELTEETGRECAEIKEYGLFYPTPGYSNEKLYIFLAKVGKEVGMHLDDTEFIDVVKVPLKKAYEMVLSGEIKDGKTAYAILRYYAEKLGNK